MTDTVLHIVSPLVRSDHISALSNFNVFLKLENMQPSGSFKIRGIGHMIVKAHNAGHTLFVCSSGGNAGIAAAYACRELGLKLKIIVPESTMPMLREKMRLLGAEVITHGAVWDEANQYALKIQEEEQAFYVPPFDHPDVWEGNSTIAQELSRELLLATNFEKPGAIVLSVGGGGLLQGVVQGIDEVGWGDVPIVAVETEGAHSYSESIKANELVTLPRITSIAKTLGAKTVCQKSFESAKTHTIVPVVVTDAMAVNACLFFADNHRMLVEPSCGAALAALTDESMRRHVRGLLTDPFAPVVVIVCGGSGVTLELLREWKAQFAL